MPRQLGPRVARGGGRSDAASAVHMSQLLHVACANGDLGRIKAMHAAGKLAGGKIDEPINGAVGVTPCADPRMRQTLDHHRRRRDLFAGGASLAG